MTKSQNSTAKIALCLDDLLLNYIEFLQHKNLNWNQLDNNLYTTTEVFQFWSHSFYFRMFKILIDNLIPTGIMVHLVENNFTRAWKFEKPEEGPKVLEVDDLLFGFNIWFGCCIISTFSFVTELGFNLLKPKKSKRIKFMKIHPTKIISLLNQPNSIELKSKLVEKFRIKKQDDDDKNSISNIEKQAFGEYINLQIVIEDSETNQLEM